MNILISKLDKKLIKFLIVGVINTLVGSIVMFSLYNFFNMSYWISSSSNYIVGSFISYFLNKYWTFQNKRKSYKIVLKFIINIIICYLLAYGIAKPLVQFLLTSFAENIKDNIAMFTGVILFTILNYFGQRFFAFKK